MFAKFKALGWVVTAVAVLTAIGLALAASKANSRRTRASNNERVATDLLKNGTSAQIKKGERLLVKVNTDKAAAVAADELAEQRLEKLGATNESLDAIATRFNSRRLRERTATDPAA